MEYFENKVAVVTGAGGTICSEISCELAKLGVRVALVGRTAEKLEDVAERITASGGECFAYPCDVTDEAALEKLGKTVIEKYGASDFLINGAGGNNQKAMPSITKFDKRELSEDRPEGFKGFYNIDMDAFESVLKINTMGTVIPTRLFARQMIEAGKHGSVINFASMNSYCPLTRCFAYAMSKSAVVSLTESLAAYFAPAGIRINAIAPGFIVNERSRNYLGTVEEGLTERGRQVISHTPMARFGEAKDITGCVKWLLDERASAFVTGTTIPVDGGFLTLSGV